MERKQISYRFEPQKRSIVMEVFFPKQTKYQGLIHEALEKGLQEETVRDYLTEHAYELQEELNYHTHLFDPHRYDSASLATLPEDQDPKGRMGMYESTFFGWSMYEVDGVFLNRRGSMDEERVQVVRLIFKYEHPREVRTRRRSYHAMCRAIIRWVLDEYGRSMNFHLWNMHEQELFLERHRSWSNEDLVYAQRHFHEIARDTAKWIDDCALFVFGYLTREFWKKVVTHPNASLEEEIWVLSNFHMNVNVLRPARHWKGRH